VKRMAANECGVARTSPRRSRERHQRRQRGRHERSASLPEREGERCAAVHGTSFSLPSPNEDPCILTHFSRWSSHNATSTGRAATRPRGKKPAQRSTTSSTLPTSTRGARSICRQASLKPGKGEVIHVMKRKHGATGDIVALQSHWGKTSRFCAMQCKSDCCCCHHQHARIGIGIQLYNLPLSPSLFFVCISPQLTARKS
jgi:hypothetical protein